MRARVFEFIASNTTNLIKKLTVIGNVWTLYSKKSNTQMPEGEFSAAMDIKQSNVNCKGQPYRSLKGDDTYHDSLGLHENDPDSNLMHYHRLAVCLDKKTGHLTGEALIKPAEMNHVLDQLKIIQRNKTHMKQLHDEPGYIEFLSKLFGQPVKIPPYKQTDYISHNDTAAFRKAYRQFYLDNKAFYAEKIQYSESTTPTSPKKTNVVTSMAFSAGLAAAIVCLRDAMIYQGVSKKQADYIVDILLIAFITKFSESFTPALVAAAIHIVTKHLPEFEHASMLKNFAAIVVYAVNSESPTSASSLINYAASSLAALYAASLARVINHTFFGDYPAEHTAPAQEYYAGLRPGFLNH